MKVSSTAAHINMQSENVNRCLCMHALRLFCHSMLGNLTEVSQICFNISIGENLVELFLLHRKDGLDMILLLLRRVKITFFRTDCRT